MMRLWERKTTSTNFEQNLKQALLNSGQDDGHWPVPYPGFPENGCIRSLYRQSPQDYILPAFIQSGISIHPDILTTYIPPYV